MYNACAKGEHRNAIQEEPLATIIHAGDIFARNEAKSNGLDLVSGTLSAQSLFSWYAFPPARFDLERGSSTS